MKKTLIAATLMLQALCLQAQDITLPAPDMNETSASVVQTLKARHSVRSFQDRQLTPQQLSNLCWAAGGLSWDDSHITAPTAMNRQEIRLFVFTADGVYEYLNRENKLKQCASGDQRTLVADRQTVVANAPAMLVFVADYSKFNGNPERDRATCNIDAGIATQNVNLYCQSVGLATVTRGSMNRNAITSLLNLTDMQELIVNNPVGYEKK